MPGENLFVLPEAVSFETGGLIADAVLTGLHAVRRAALRLGDRAVVLGAGGVGQILIQLLSATGVRVVAIDRFADKPRLAREMGAAAAFDVETALADVPQFAGGGVECVFNCVGTSASMRLAASLVMRCGRIVVIGEEPGGTPVDTTEIAQQELEIIGSRNGTRQDMADAIKMVAAGTLRPYVAARFPLDRINDAFDCVRAGALGRVVVVIKE